MLTLAAVGGFFVPIVFGHVVPHTSFNTGRRFLAVVSFVFALVGLLGRNPARESVRRIPAAPGLEAVNDAINQSRREHR
ncbi:hypothetical protein OG948_56300 (plasmid) [Embleya sp. NBC_00888]|uniref:hypothetical protein n=1 Tax=Embleya sp. NBC_00888 TaxID=2975960 RepID=UPI002F90F3B8|nr:hypothetical protein OG948_56300 [Embleya sp. NBC_00888]